MTTTSSAGATSGTKQGSSSPGAATAGRDGAPSAPVDKLSTRYLLRWMFRFFKPVRGFLLLACIYVSLWVAAETLANYQAGKTVNHITNIQITDSGKGLTPMAWLFGATQDAVLLRQHTLVLVAMVITYALLRYLKEVSGVKLSMTVVYYIREGVYDKLQRLGFSFHDAMSTGQLINRALSDLQNVRVFIQNAVLMTLEILLVVIFNIMLIAKINGSLAWLSLAPLPLWTWYILRFSKVVQPAAAAVMEAEDKNVSIVTENIAGVHVIKAFATEQLEMNKYGTNCDSFKAKVLKRIRLFANFNPIIRSIAMASYLTLFYFGGILKVKGRIQAGDLMVMGVAMNAILSRLQGVATINEQYQNAIVSAKRLYEVMSADPAVPEKADAKPLPKGGEGKLVFENVTFGYDPQKPVLHNLSFTVPGGGIIAVVGPTGAGKSTMVNLISRFYDPQSGRILIDDVDLRDVTLDSLRSEIGFVFQETYLFSDTVSANIAYGRPGISPGDIEAAARLAQAHEFIESMPKGYDTILAERGSSLSGGQKQRLAIARAILTNPRILVLDDATAAVDPETEDLIRRGTKAVMHSRTTFVIAHRISTVKRANLVLVLEHGRITQMGTHDELMKQDGHYREIAAVQLGDDRVAAEHPSHMQRVQDSKSVAQVTADAKEMASSGASEEQM